MTSQVTCEVTCEVIRAPVPVLDYLALFHGEKSFGDILIKKGEELPDLFFGIDYLDDHGHINRAGNLRVGNPVLTCKP